MPLKPDWIPGVDGSYTRLTPQAAEDLRAAGELVWWQCLWTGAEQPPNRIKNLQIAVAAGLIPMAYISLAAGAGGRWHLEHGRAGVPDDLWQALVLVVVDVELPAIAGMAVRDAVEALATPEYGEKRRAIYTSYHAWVDLMHNPTTFTDCLLINALWDEDPDIDFAGLPYGGWTLDQLVGEQFNGGTEIAGVYVDLDMFNRSLLEVAMPDDIARLALLVQLAGWIMSGDPALAEKAYMTLKYLRLVGGLPV